MDKKIKAFIKASYGTCVGLLTISLVMFIIFLFYKFLNFIGLNLIIESNALLLTMTILATFGMALYIYNISRENQKEDELNRQIDLLKVLSEELNFLEKNLKSYKESFSLREGYPLYGLWDIDVSIYFKNLSHKINSQETIDLKKNLMMIKDKILLINNFKVETKKIEEERGHERIIKEVGVIKMNREQITKIIDEVLPVVEKSKKFIEEKFKINPKK